ncbi:MAG: ribosome silencing factor [Alphaproteobacteria bacterium]
MPSWAILRRNNRRSASIPTASKTVRKPKLAARRKPKAPSIPTATRKLRDLVVRTLDTQKGEDIATLDIGAQCSFADVMIVASGRSARHVAALADYVTRAVRDAGGRVLSTEGQQTGDWVLIDLGDIVVHLFRPEMRQLYNLEKMWALPAPTRR